MFEFRVGPSRLASLALALAPAYVLAIFVASPVMPTAMKVAALLVLLLTLFRPAYGLIAVAAIVPLGDVTMPLFQAAPATRAESLVLAFIAGWLASRAFANRTDRAAVSTAAAGAMWVFGCVLLASVATTALHLFRANPQQLQAAWSALARSYLWTDDPIGAHTAGNLLEGIALVVAGAELLRRDPRLRFALAGSLVAAATVVSVASGLLSAGIAPATTLSRTAAIGLARYSASMTDVNAAASYYLLIIGVAAGIAASVARLRAVWLIAAVALVGGLKLTGSRAGFLAGAVVFCAAGVVWIGRATSPRSKRIAAFVLVPVFLIAIAAVASRSAQSSLEMRGGFTRASLRIIEARPLFGIGAGRYYRMSRLALSPTLAWFYGQENAHDYYLQTAAELGIVGAAAFLSMLAALLVPPLKGVARGGIRWSTAGAAAGALAYLLTAAGGHPFLVPEAAIPFWIVIGLLASEGSVGAASGKWLRAAAVAVGCLLLLTVPFRPDEPRMRLPAGDDGFGPWQTDEHGVAFHESKDFASIFVEPNVRGVEVPMRLGAGYQAGSVLIEVVVPGAFERYARPGSEWSTLLVELPGAEPLMPRQRINLSLHPGVEIGQIKILAAQ